MTDPLLLSPAQAARALGIGRSSLYKLLAAGDLESVRIGACRRVPADALLQVVARLRDEPQAAEYVSKDDRRPPCRPRPPSQR